LLKLQSPTENRMDVHKNARLTPRGRERIVLQVESGQTPEAVAQAVGVCPRTVRKWVDSVPAKAWRDCTIGHPGRVDCGSGRLKR
jgi:DNA-binding NarL/FixJ family response regulator